MGSLRGRLATGAKALVQHAEIRALAPGRTIADHIHPRLGPADRHIEQVGTLRGPILGPRALWITAQHQDNDFSLLALGRVNAAHPTFRAVSDAKKGRLAKPSCSPLLDCWHDINPLKVQCPGSSMRRAFEWHMSEPGH